MADTPNAPAAPVSSPNAPETGNKAPSNAPSAGKPNAPRAAPSNKPGVGSQVDPKTPAPAAPKPETKPASEERKEYKFKVNGKDVTKRFTEAELHTYLQKGLAADDGFSQLAAERKKLREFYQRGKENPAEVLKEMFGLDFGELAEKHLAEKMKRATMSEEERAALELREENDKYKRQFQEMEASKKRQEQQAYEDKLWQETEAGLLKALNEVGLEKNHETLYLVADVQEAAIKNGYELSPAQLVQEARARASSYAKNTIFKLKGESLLTELGDDVVNEVLRAEVARRRGTLGRPQLQTPAPTQAAPEAPPVATRRRQVPQAQPDKQPEMSEGRKRVARRFGLLND